MSKTEYRAYLYEVSAKIEEYCQVFFNCGPFSSAYQCRRWVDRQGNSAKVVRLGNFCYMPMTSEIYRDWHRYQRMIAALDAE